MVQPSPWCALSLMHLCAEVHRGPDEPGLVNDRASAGYLPLILLETRGTA
jgi:hypothetical protein